MREHDVISVKQAAALLNVSQPTIRRAIRSGRLQAIRVNGGRLLRTRVAWVETYFTACSAATQLVEEEGQ